MSYLFITIGAVVLSYYMAEKRGRSTKLAIVGGFLFGLLAPLYYLIAGDSQEMREEKMLVRLAAKTIENAFTK